MVIPILLTVIVFLGLVCMIQGLKIWAYKKQRAEFLHVLNNKLQVILSTEYDMWALNVKELKPIYKQIEKSVMEIKRAECMLKECKL